MAHICLIKKFNLELWDKTHIILTPTIEKERASTSRYFSTPYYFICSFYYLNFHIFLFEWSKQTSLWCFQGSFEGQSICLWSWSFSILFIWCRWIVMLAMWPSNGDKRFETWSSWKFNPSLLQKWRKRLWLWRLLSFF